MNTQSFLDLMKQYQSKNPSFPDGRINYTNADTAPVLSLFIEFKGKILLLKRSDKVATYKGKWNILAGYLDEVRPITDKIYEELREEINVKEDDIAQIYYGADFLAPDGKIGKTWHIFPILVSLLEEPHIELDWEHTDYTWINPEDILTYDTTPKIEDNLQHVLKFINKVS